MFGIKEVQAHCDIPCKIYDPATAQIAVLSVIRLLDLIAELGDTVTSKSDLGKKKINQIKELQYCFMILI